MTVSRIAVLPGKAGESDEIIGAALVAHDQVGPNLDLLFVRPAYHRQGIATALASVIMNALYAEGEKTLGSAYDLANEPSRSWHTKFGFVEEPDLYLAQSRAHHARWELIDEKNAGNLSEGEINALEDRCLQLEAYAQELETIGEREGKEAVIPIFRRRTPR